MNMVFMVMLPTPPAVDVTYVIEEEDENPYVKITGTVRDAIGFWR